MDAAAWDASLARLRNPHGLEPVRLPFEVKLFTHIPVVVGAHLSIVSGHPMDIAARVYTEATADAAAAGRAAEEGEGAAAGPREMEGPAAAALPQAEAARGGLHLGVLVDTMFED
jgi:hypothetical protein